MNILGLDYGRAKMGVALGDTGSKLAEPIKILRYKDIKILSDQIKKLILEEKVEKIIIGVSEGDMADETRKFGRTLEKNIEIPVEFFDETLTSLDAQKLSIEAGIRRKKRKGMEDAYAAALILEAWLDNLN